MRFLVLALAGGALICGPASLMAQDSRSPDTQKQQHPENNPKPKTSTGPDSGSGSSQLNQGDVPKDMPSDGGSTSTRSGHKKKSKAKTSSTTH